VTVPSGFSDFTRGLTILAFVNFGSVQNSWERILDFGQGPEYNNILFSRGSTEGSTDSDLRFQIYNGLNQSISLNTVLSSGIIENAWGFYVARLDGATYLLRNQNTSTSGSTTVLPANVTRTLNYIGRSNWADPYFEGRMGVVAVYNTALSNADISGFFDTYKARYLPAKPTGLVATAGDGEVSISFTAGSNNGSTITNYQYSTDNGASYSVFSPADTTSPVVISGLTNGTSYNIKLRAVNTMGAGEASDTVTATPVSPIPSGNIYTSPTTNEDVDISAVSPFLGGGYSYSFNGTSEYLTVSGDNAWAFGTGDFTIEWFQYQTDNSTFPRIFAIGASGTRSIGCSIENGTFYTWLPAANDFNSSVPYKNTWVHFAIVRSSGILRVYKNGVQLGGNISNNYNVTDNSTILYIGVENQGNPATSSSNTWFGGYLTNIRIVKGLAVYTGNFTTPTSSLTLTASANPYSGSNTAAIPAGYTKLLLTGPPPPTIVLDPGNVSSYSGSGTTITSIGTSNGVSGTLSNVTYNAGSGGYFTFAGTGTSHINFSIFDFGTEFTLIAWVRPSEQSNINTLFATAGVNQATSGFKLGWNYWNGNTKPMWYEGGDISGLTGSSSVSADGIITIGSWQQVTYVFNKANPKIDFYKNGTLLTSSGTPVANIPMNKAWRIGNMFGSYAMKSDVGLLKIYPAVLTTAEILADYNATKSRYGL
jgi:hypothetical protein